MLASGKVNKPEPQQTAMFLTLVGENALRVYNTFKWDEDEDKTKLAKVKEKFSEYCKGHTSQAVIRNKFFTREQNEGETIDQYVTELKTLAKDCEFEQITESIIRDIVVFGVQSESLKEKCSVYLTLT
jgi:hypothetical protein